MSYRFFFAKSEFFTKHNGFADTFDQRSPVEARERQESTKSATKLNDRNNERNERNETNDRFKGNLEDCLGLRVSRDRISFEIEIYIVWLCYMKRRPEWKASTWWQSCWELSLDEFVESLTSSSCNILPFLTRPVHTLVYDDGEDAKLLPWSYSTNHFVDILLAFCWLCRVLFCVWSVWVEVRYVS